MRGRGLAILCMASACGAYALGFEVGPLLGYGTPQERNALKSYEVNMGATTVDAGRGPGYSGRAAVRSAPWTAELAASYMKTEAITEGAYETTRVGENAWAVTAAASYALPELKMEARLELGYGRFDVVAETGRALEEPEELVWTRSDYGGDVYRAAVVFEPTLLSWRERLGLRLALGPALSYVAREGEAVAKDPWAGNERIKYGDVVADFCYGCGVDVALTGRYGAALDLRGTYKLGELRAEYPGDAAGGFYVTLAPYARFGGK
jgi:hypothetical protein